jgi:hypothetical protein
MTQPRALGQQLQLLTLYEQRISRSLQKNLAILQSVQATRKAAIKEAAALLKLSEIKGLEYDPAKDGFVFATLKSTPPSTANTASNAPRPWTSPNPGSENSKHRLPEKR